MAARVLHHKGTGVLPVVTALKSHPRGVQAVPAALRHYLNSALVATAWYPADDFHALLQALAQVLERDGVADVWGYFGRTAAQRDLKGSQSAIPAERRHKTAGLYRPFASQDITIASMFLRLSKLWTLYHDCGRLLTGRSPSDDAKALVRVLDAHFPTQNLVYMQMAYFCEYARILGIHLTGRIVRATCSGDPYTEWEYSCERTQPNLESLALLPLLH